MARAWASVRFLERYSRQFMVRGVGLKGQVRLAESSVAIVGCGATGSLEAEMMVRLGVGRIRLIDGDFVDISNLHRTHLFTEEDVEEFKPKALACRDHLARINRDVEIEAVVETLDPGNAERLLGGVDLILDGTDNMPSRFLINDFSVKHGVPWIYVGVEQWYGMVATFPGDGGPCLRCLIPSPEERYGFFGVQENPCEVMGVVSSTVGMVVSVAVTEALKILLGLSTQPRIFLIDGYDPRLETLSIAKGQGCPTCVKGRFDYLNARPEAGVSVRCGADNVTVSCGGVIDIGGRGLGSVDGLSLLKVTPYAAKISYKGHTILLFRHGKMVFLKTTDVEDVRRRAEELIEILAAHGLIKGRRSAPQGG